MDKLDEEIILQIQTSNDGLAEETNFSIDDGDMSPILSIEEIIRQARIQIARTREAQKTEGFFAEQSAEDDSEAQTDSTNTSDDKNDKCKIDNLVEVSDKLKEGLDDDGLEEDEEEDDDNASEKEDLGSMEHEPKESVISTFSTSTSPNQISPNIMVTNNHKFNQVPNSVQTSPSLSSLAFITTTKEESSTNVESSSAKEEIDKFISVEGKNVEDVSLTSNTSLVATSVDDTDSLNKKKNKKKKGKVYYYLGLTKYRVVGKAFRQMQGWVEVENEEDDWDIMWMDSSVSADRLIKMKPYQRINHFVGTTAIARKNFLARNLIKMQKHFPDAFKFFPQSWSLPADASDFRAQFNGKRKTFIIKPDASSQGRGIFLTRRFEDVPSNEHLVAQKYIQKPLLIDGLKFDMRIYVLMTGCNPLRVFVHTDGLARFATQTYISPTGKNMAQTMMHLTNYSINKSSNKFEQNLNPEDANCGHKRSLRHVFDKLQAEGYDMEGCLKEMDDLIVKTIVAIQPTLAHIYTTCQPDDLSNSSCFEILGFDILIDHKLKPWLIEVNHSPSFSTDSELDSIIKSSVIVDALALMNVNAENRKAYKVNRRAQMVSRLMRDKNQLKSRDERLADRQCMVEDLAKQRTKWESSNLGGFRRVYPTEERTAEYAPFFESAEQMFANQSGLANRKNSLATGNGKSKNDLVNNCNGSANSNDQGNNGASSSSAALSSGTSSSGVSSTSSTARQQFKLRKSKTVSIKSDSNTKGSCGDQKLARRNSLDQENANDSTSEGGQNELEKNCKKVKSIVRSIIKGEGAKKILKQTKDKKKPISRQGGEREDGGDTSKSLPPRRAQSAVPINTFHLCISEQQSISRRSSNSSTTSSTSTSSTKSQSIKKN